MFSCMQELRFHCRAGLAAVQRHLFCSLQTMKPILHGQLCSLRALQLELLGALVQTRQVAQHSCEDDGSKPEGSYGSSDAEQCQFAKSRRRCRMYQYGEV